MKSKNGSKIFENGPFYCWEVKVRQNEFSKYRGPNMVKIRSNFDISKVTFATTVPIHATVVADNVRMEL